MNKATMAGLRIAMLSAVCLVAWGAAFGADGDFDTWFKKEWNGSVERTNALKQLETVAADPSQGPGAVVRRLRDHVADAEVSSAEQAWQSNMLCHMDRSYLDDLNHVQPGQALSTGTTDAIKGKAGTFKTLGGLARFRPDPATASRFYRIFPGSVAPCAQIEIDPSSTSTVAREIYKAADLLSQLQADNSIPALESMARSVEEARARWNLFFENVVYDGFPWELYANEGAKSFIPALRGTLAQPPSAQIRLLHPTPLMAVATEGETTFKANFGIEALGWRVYDTETYSPRWGVSALVSLRESRDESTGYGLLATFRGWSVGLIQRDTAQKDNEIQIVVGIDVAEWIQKQRAKGGGSLLGAFEELDKDLNAGWKSAEEAASN
jgi:hypothetical protein